MACKIYIQVCILKNCGIWAPVQPKKQYEDSKKSQLLGWDLETLDFAKDKKKKKKRMLDFGYLKIQNIPEFSKFR